MLTGPELLAKVKELGAVSKSEMVRACGYTTNDRLNFTAFYEALLQAKGVELAASSKKAGRKLTYKAKVQSNHALQIGEAYLKQMGAAPGAVFDIKVGRNSITLTAA